MATSYQIEQDSFGFLWSATTSGLVRTDGLRYKKYFHNRSDSTSIATNFSRNLHIDPFQNIWVNSAGYGLSILDRSADIFVRLKHNSAGNRLNNLAIYSMATVGDDIFIGGSGGLEKVELVNEDYGNLVFENLKIPEDIKAKYNYGFTVWHIMPEGEGILWLSTSFGLMRYDIITNDWQHSSNNRMLPSGQGFYAQLVKNDLWISYGNQALIKMNIETFDKKVFPELVFKNGEVYMENDSYGHLWIKENGYGINVIDLNTETVTRYPDVNNNPIGHKDRWARRMTSTHDGTLYLAGGSNARFNHIPASQKMINTKNRSWYDVEGATSCLEDDTHIVITSRYSGLHIVDKKTGIKTSLTSYNSSLESDLIYKAVKLVNGNYVICGKPSAYILDIKTKRLQLLATTGLFYRNAFESEDGVIWLMGESEGVTAIDEKGEIQSTPNALTRMNIREVIKQSDHTYFVISDLEGLIHMASDGTIIKNYNPRLDAESTLIDQSAGSMIQTMDGNLWIGTLSGLSVWDRNKDSWYSFDTNDGFDDSNISALVQDEHGTVWITTYEGLYHTNPENIEIIKYSLGGSFRNLGFATRAATSYDNYILLAGNEGVDVFNPTMDDKNKIPPKVQLISVITDGHIREDLPCTECIKRLTIQHQQRNTNLQFSALHYVNPKENKLEYSIPSIDIEWTELSNGSLRLGELPRGTYDLSVRGLNSDGVAGAPRIWSLNLKKPWWSTIPAILCFGLLGCMSVFIFIKYRENKFREVQQKEQDLFNELAEIELKALKAQMNPHFIFNSLNSVKALIANGKNSSAIKYLTQYSELVRKVLNNSNSKFVRLEDEIEICRLYIELESMRFDQGFSYTIDIASAVGIDFIEVPPMIIQPFVENAIWHGLLHKTVGTKVLGVAVDLLGENIVIKITDNGIGRQASARINTRSKSKGQSLGTLITEKRLQLLEKKYNRKASIGYLDLIGSDGSPEGTEITITIQN